MPNRFSRVFVTGGAGYVGSVLVPRLLERGYKVTSYDISYYGDNFLPKNNPNLHGHSRRHPRHREACASSRRPRRLHQPRLHLQRCKLRTRRESFDLGQSRRLRADGARRQEGGRQALHLRVVEFGLRRVRSAERDRRPSAGPAHALQQVQGHVRAAAVQAYRPELRRRRVSARRRCAATRRVSASTFASTS